MFTKEALQELKIILKEDYGTDLSDDEVFIVAYDLTNFFSELSKCLRSEDA